MNLRTVFRVQDADGRGPFRPGFSKQWSDAGSTLLRPPTWMEEFGEDAIGRLGRPGEVFGSGVRTLAGLARWFTPTEAERLHRFGFRAVSVPGCRILAESEHQVLLARSRPLFVGVQVRNWP